MNLSLADLEQHDLRAPDPGNRERRFLCPLPACADHQRPTEHRCLSVNTLTGTWVCHRCMASGLLTERHADRRPLSRAYSDRRELRQFTALSSYNRRIVRPAENEYTIGHDKSTATSTNDSQWRAMESLRAELDRLTPTVDTPGGVYLAGRGIPPKLANRTAYFSVNWRLGGPAVVFLLQDANGDTVAAQGRYLDPLAKPKVRSAGSISTGVYATPAAIFMDLLVLTEAPIDAMSLHTCGLPAIALCGTALRGWLLPECTKRRVLLAFDRDEAGERAAEEWAKFLMPYGAQVKRLRPKADKDWNAILQEFGLEKLAAALRADLLAAYANRTDEWIRHITVEQTCT